MQRTLQLDPGLWLERLQLLSTHTKTRASERAKPYGTQRLLTKHAQTRGMCTSGPREAFSSNTVKCREKTECDREDWLFIAVHAVERTAFACFTSVSTCTANTQSSAMVQSSRLLSDYSRLFSPH